MTDGCGGGRAEPVHSLPTLCVGPGRLLRVPVMTVEALAAWLFTIMVATVPPGGWRATAQARETAEQSRARYRAIAEAIAEVSLDPKEKPLFDGADGRARTAALLLAISLHESHWRRDVDLGLGRYGPRSGRRYHCLMQIAIDRGKTPEGWSAADLIRDRERCLRAALHILQRGRRYCDEAGPRAFLNHYASGYCDRGRKHVARRWKSYHRFLREHPIPKSKPPTEKRPAARRPGRSGGR